MVLPAFTANGAIQAAQEDDPWERVDDQRGVMIVRCRSRSWMVRGGARSVGGIMDGDRPRWFTGISTSIAVLNRGASPITGMMEVQIIKSIVAVDSNGYAWEWGNDRWVRLADKNETEHQA